MTEWPLQCEDWFTPLSYIGLDLDHWQHRYAANIENQRMWLGVHIGLHVSTHTTASMWHSHSIPRGHYSSHSIPRGNYSLNDDYIHNNIPSHIYTNIPSHMVTTVWTITTFTLTFHPTFTLIPSHVVTTFWTIAPLHMPSSNTHPVQDLSDALPYPDLHARSLLASSPT